MGPIFFKKMHGSGNDFILIDNRDGRIGDLEAPDLSLSLCRRRFGVGADGLILIEGSSKADFKWRFYNADGSEAEMCGNGGRCAARFAVSLGIALPELSFETIAGIMHAHVIGSTVKLQLPAAKGLCLDIDLKIEDEQISVDFLNTGVPHAVCFVPELKSIPIKKWGRAIRYNPYFQPSGTNVDFVQVLDRHDILIRTYERGVEAETMACGTGAVATAILSALRGLTQSPVKVKTSGGEILTVYFELNDKEARDIFLEGPALFVYSGQIEEDLINTTAI
ncbi:MAG: diaminopimelate epimerase [Nitrospiraceae bacterium]|nr:diaminopimelate epimerase [Nitrospiraceae bacterium]